MLNTFKINTSEDSKNLEILKCIKNDVSMIYIIRTNEKITTEEIEARIEKALDDRLAKEEKKMKKLFLP